MLQIRKAEIPDAEAISQIHNLWTIDPASPSGDAASKGFLLGSTSPKEVAIQLQDAAQYTLVADIDRRVVGYLVAHQQCPEVDSVVWRISSWKPLLTDPRHFHINQVALDPTCLRRGVARQLYQRLGEYNDRGPLSCYVASTPFDNQVSLAFHLSLGFSVAGDFSAGEFYGFKNYSSHLLIKP